MMPCTSSTKGTSAPCPHATAQPSSAEDTAYYHVLMLVGFDRVSKPDHPVFLALATEAYTTFHSLFQLRRADVEAMMYPVVCNTKSGGAPVLQHLPLGFQSALLVPQGYGKYYQETYDHALSPSDWLKVTSADILQYIMSDEYMFYNNTLGSSTGAPVKQKPILPVHPTTTMASMVGRKQALIRDDVSLLNPPSLDSEEKLLLTRDKQHSKELTARSIMQSSMTIAPAAGLVMLDHALPVLGDIDPDPPPGNNEEGTGWDPPWINIDGEILVADPPHSDVEADTGWDPPWYTNDGEIPNVHAAAIPDHMKNSISVDKEAFFHAEAIAVKEATQVENHLWISHCKNTIVANTYTIACPIVFSAVQLIDPKCLNRGVDPDDDHGLTHLHGVMAHADPPPPPEPPPVTHHPPSSDVYLKVYIPSPLATLCLTSLFDGEQSLDILVQDIKQDGNPFTNLFDGELSLGILVQDIKQDANPFMTHSHPMEQCRCQCIEIMVNGETWFLVDVEHKVIVVWQYYKKKKMLMGAPHGEGHPLPTDKVPDMLLLLAYKTIQYGWEHGEIIPYYQLPISILPTDDQVLMWSLYWISNLGSLDMIMSNSRSLPGCRHIIWAASHAAFVKAEEDLTTPASEYTLTLKEKRMHTAITICSLHMIYQQVALQILLRVFSWLLGVLLLEESNYYMLYGKIKSTVINSSMIIQPYNVLILHERQDASVFKPVHEAQLSEAHQGVQCVHIHGENYLTDAPSIKWGDCLVWYMLNVLTSEKGDTCGESPKDNDRKTIKVTGSSMITSGSNSTSMCSIQPHKWENEIRIAFIWLDLALSGCAIPQDIDAKSDGCEMMMVGCSSGSGSDTVLSMLSDVPMWGMLTCKHDVYDAVDSMPVECMNSSLIHGMDNIPMFGTYDMVNCVTILRVGIHQVMRIAKRRLDSLTRDDYLRVQYRRFGDNLASFAHRGS